MQAIKQLGFILALVHVSVHCRISQSMGPAQAAPHTLRSLRTLLLMAAFASLLSISTNTRFCLGRRAVVTPVPKTADREKPAAYRASHAALRASM